MARPIPTRERKWGMVGLHRMGAALTTVCPTNPARRQGGKQQCDPRRHVPPCHDGAGDVRVSVGTPGHGGSAQRLRGRGTFTGTRARWNRRAPNMDRWRRGQAVGDPAVRVGVGVSDGQLHGRPASHRTVGTTGSRDCPDRDRPRAAAGLIARPLSVSVGTPPARRHRASGTPATYRVPGHGGLRRCSADRYGC